MRLPYPATTVTDQRQAVYACVERWSARLSKGDESIRDVSQAAVAACEDAIVLLRSFADKEQSDLAREGQAEFWTRRAHFIAVQTRAGNCYPDA